MLLAQRIEAIGVRRESAGVGPEREEQHAGERTVGRVQFVVRRSVVLQESPVDTSSVRVVDMGERAYASEKSGLTARSGARLKSGVTTQVGPAAAGTQYIAELRTRLLEEGRQGLVAVRPELFEHVLPAAGNLAAKVGEDHLLRDLVEQDLAAGRQKRE